MIRSNNRNNFHIHLVELIENSEKKGCFIFQVENNDPVKSLKRQSENVPDESGMYFVFSENEKEDNPYPFIIDNKPFELLYFGKAGQKLNGKRFKQQLQGRINNVVSDSSRRIKDKKRGNYWDLILNELGKTELFIIWIISQKNCAEDENNLYAIIKSQNFDLPFLNKKRGRP